MEETTDCKQRDGSAMTADFKVRIIKVKIKGILFDMDGVLVSSIGSVERSWTKWALEVGLDPTEAIAAAHGRRSIDSVRAMRPDLNAEIENQKILDWEVEDREGVEQLVGVSALIAQLPATAWTVVTSAARRLAISRLEAAGIVPPEKFISGDEVTRGKPDPEPYRKGAELLGFDPGDCLVIEDAVSGATAGRAAGCRVLATTLSHSIESLVAADWIVETLEGIHVTPLPGEWLELVFEPLPRPVRE
jgi:sugar-phosphatase